MLGDFSPLIDASLILDHYAATYPGFAFRLERLARLDVNAQTRFRLSIDGDARTVEIADWVLVAARGEGARRLLDGLDEAADALVQRFMDRQVAQCT